MYIHTYICRSLVMNEFDAEFIMMLENLRMLQVPKRLGGRLLQTRVLDVEAQHRKQGAQTVSTLEARHAQEVANLTAKLYIAEQEIAALKAESANKTREHNLFVLKLTEEFSKLSGLEIYGMDQNTMGSRSVGGRGGFGEAKGGSRSGGGGGKWRGHIVDAVLSVQYEFQGKLESWQPDAVLDCTRDALNITLGYDIVGHDLAFRNFVQIKTRVVKLETCVHECWFNEKCLGFSYDLDTTECWLKDAAAAPALPTAGIVSGVVKQSARKQLTEQLQSEYPDKLLREAFFKKCERHSTNSSALNISPSDCAGLRIEGVGEDVENIYMYIYTCVCVCVCVRMYVCMYNIYIYNIYMYNINL